MLSQAIIICKKKNDIIKQGGREEKNIDSGEGEEEEEEKELQEGRDPEGDGNKDEKVIYFEPISS